MKYEITLKSGATLTLSANTVTFPTNEPLLPVTDEHDKPSEKYRILSSEVVAVIEAERKETRATLASGRV